MTNICVKVQTLPHFKGLTLPAYQSQQAAGFDLPAAISEDITLSPLARALIPTGLSIELPYGYEAQIRPRSGLAIKNGISVLNSPGTIDSDYRGEIQVILINLSAETFTITRGMRIAQMVVTPVTQAQLLLSDLLSDSERGSGGFGHSGL